MKRETHFVLWSDGAVTVIYREKRDNGTKLADYMESHTYSGDEARELAEQFSRVTKVPV